MTATDSEPEFAPEEIAQRRDALLLRLLKSPPKAREDMKIGKRKVARKKAPTTARAKTGKSTG
jgi:GrpB-like predicted nucleotidyltransferase (UPF0157 family)